MKNDEEYVKGVSEAAAPFGLVYWYVVYKNGESGKLHALRVLDYSEADVEADFAKENQLYGWNDKLLLVLTEPPPDLPVYGFRTRS